MISLLAWRFHLEVVRALIDRFTLGFRKPIFIGATPFRASGILNLCLQRILIILCIYYHTTNSFHLIAVIGHIMGHVKYIIIIPEHDLIKQTYAVTTQSSH